MPQHGFLWGFFGFFCVVFMLQFLKKNWIGEGIGEVFFSDFWIFFNLTRPLSTKHLCNICTMLDQRRSRWADIV